MYSLYGQSIYILLYLSTLLLATISVGVWEFSYPGGGQIIFPYHQVEALYGCLYVPSPRLGRVAGTYLGAYLAFDISVFVLTMMQTRRAVWSNRGPELFRRIAHDGALYFIVISSSVCVWLFMVLFAPLEIKSMNALPTLCLVATMINRLTINIRADIDRGFVGQDTPYRAESWSQHLGDTSNLPTRVPKSSFTQETATGLTEELSMEWEGDALESENVNSRI